MGRMRMPAAIAAVLAIASMGWAQDQSAWVKAHLSDTEASAPFSFVYDGQASTSINVPGCGLSVGLPMVPMDDR
jgi:hypothetical protein